MFDSGKSASTIDSGKGRSAGVERMWDGTWEGVVYVSAKESSGDTYRMVRKESNWRWVLCCILS